MTFQFKPRIRQAPRNQELEQEIKRLIQYNQALQKDNKAKDEQKKNLQNQILRLSTPQKNSKHNNYVAAQQKAQQTKQLSEIRQKYSQLKDNYNSLQQENNIINLKLKNIEYTKSLLLAYERDISQQNQILRSRQFKIKQLQIKLAQYQSQIALLKQQKGIPSPAITHYQATTSRFTQIQSQIRRKNQEIIDLKIIIGTQEDQATAFKNQISIYLHKINMLTAQIEQLKRSSIHPIIRSSQYQEVSILKSKLQNIHALNANLATQINQLRNENFRALQIIKERQRRIYVLQQSNKNLEMELRLAPEAQKSTSTVVRQSKDDVNLKQAVITLKKQLQTVKTINTILKQQNNQLRSELQKLRRQQDNSKSHHRYLSKSPKSTVRLDKEDKIPRSQIIQTRNTFNGSFNKKSPINKINIQNQAKSTAKPKRSGINPSAVLQNQRYNYLERKINMLQNENQVLKKQLIYQV